MRTPEVALEGRRGRATVDVELPPGEPLTVSIDLYTFQRQVHPDHHLGWWHVGPGPGAHRLDLDFDFREIGPGSLRVGENGRPLALPNSWVNPDYPLAPVLDAKVVVWTAANEIVGLARFPVVIRDPEVVKACSERQYREEGYVPQGPFLELLHRRKLRLLHAEFRRRFRGRTLDVGCGLSLFTAGGATWPFPIVAGDVVPGRMRERKADRPDLAWLVFDASALPFRAGTFDGLFAGEIVEHLPDAPAALREWNRVLRPGGTLIVTTPNRDRRVNRLNRDAWRFSPDHLRELSERELDRELLPAAGFRVVRRRGIYLELWTKSNGWWREDRLQREGNVARNAPLMKLLMALGRWFPSRALALVTVARKK